MHCSYATTDESLLQNNGCMHCNYATTDESVLQTYGVYASQLRYHSRVSAANTGFACIAVTPPQTSHCCKLVVCMHCSYATTDESVLETYSQADAFSKLSAAATKVAQQQSEMPAGDIASMYIALLGFTGKVYPDKLDYTDKVLTECYQASFCCVL